MNSLDGQLRVEPPTQTRRVERFAARQEEKIWADFKKFWGESLVEEPEDEIFSLIAQEADYLADKLCSEKSGTVSDVTCALSTAWCVFFFSNPVYCFGAANHSGGDGFCC
uniref:DUF3456 domain-containing protein n=1 Tax=Anas platyrhynchos platyrhynchos TaxID=8840 RepID=A0A493TG07_ANAPP